MLNGFYQARLAGSGEKASQYISPDATELSPGGITLLLAQRVRHPPARPTATLIRHVKVLTPDSAVAIALWRTPEAKPPDR